MSDERRAPSRRPVVSADPEAGATILEYIFVASLISIAAVVVLGTIGGQLRTYFENFVNAFN